MPRPLGFAAFNLRLISGILSECSLTPKVRHEVAAAVAAVGDRRNLTCCVDTTFIGRRYSEFFGSRLKQLEVLRIHTACLVHQDSIHQLDCQA